MCRDVDIDEGESVGNIPEHKEEMAWNILLQTLSPTKLAYYCLGITAEICRNSRDKSDLPNLEVAAWHLNKLIAELRK